MIYDGDGTVVVEQSQPLEVARLVVPKSYHSHKVDDSYDKFKNEWFISPIDNCVLQ